MFNEFYARDTSRKIRSVFKSKGMSGKHLTGTVIYGYLWDEKREHWLVDEEAAEVVRRIFSLTLEGYGPYQIAGKLSADRIEIPVVHLARFNEGVNRSKPVKDPYGWGSSTIVNILKKREYLGHTINFKTRKHFKDKKSHYVSEDEWTIFENTHEAIIDQQTFDLVQKIRSNVRRYPNGWGETAPLTGLLYCADCGGKMYVHRTNNGRRISQYTCSNYTKVPCGTLCPTQHRINESAVLTLLNDPRILILDEPTAGLDPKERVRFRNLISSLAENRIVILSTHIVSDVEYIANEILIMKNGELIQHGSPEEILKPIEKCVWECDVSRKEAEELELNYVTANLKHNNGAERLRIISQEAPCRTAWNVDPTLEDLYLYYFAEVSEHE